MTKVVYNSCYGGFSFSTEACKRLIELGVQGADKDGSREVSRHDPLVIQVVEELGEKASGSFASLSVKSIQSSRYRIYEYDGLENVQEPKDITWVRV